MFAIVPGCVLASAQLSWTSGILHRAVRGWYEANTVYITFRSRSPVARLANRDLKSNAWRVLRYFKSDLNNAGRPMAGSFYAIDMRPTVGFADKRLISLYFLDYQDLGGAHPATWLECHSYGLVRGRAKRLRLEDLFRDGAAGKQEVNVIAMRSLRASGASMIANGSLKAVPDSDLESFVITPTALTLEISPYDVASYAEGPQVVKISLSRLEGLNVHGPLSPILVKRR